MSKSEIVPGLFVGSRPFPGRRPRVDVDTIVLAAIEYQPPAELFPEAEVIHVPLDDDSSRPLRDAEILAATKAGNLVARRLREGRRVLVSCAMGLNRSALIAALAIHEVYGMNADEIIARIRQARGSWALTNPNFSRLLRAVVEVNRTP